jgi:hypothetical protein
MKIMLNISLYLGVNFSPTKRGWFVRLFQLERELYQVA